jgi:hypothetical protein
MSASFTIEQAFKLYTIACRAQRHSLIEKMSKLIGGYDPRDWPGAMAMALSGEDLFRLVSGRVTPISTQQAWLLGQTLTALSGTDVGGIRSQ